ncbi:auxin efflux carrier [Blastocladiella britannica]|nr:auxin efflux carrier [Blastocladiella britannica]
MSTGQAIWAGARAMLKVACVCGAGGLAFRMQVFDRPTSKNLANMFIKLFLPMLTFSKVSVAFTSDNIRFAGVIIAFGSGYLIFGHLVGILVYLMFRNKMPVHLRKSLIPATAFTNQGDLPLSIIVSLAGTGPFTSADVDKGVAFVAVWYSVFNLFFYAFSIRFFEADFAALARVEDAADPELEEVALSDNVRGDDGNDEEEADVLAKAPESPTSSHSAAAASPAGAATVTYVQEEANEGIPLAPMAPDDDARTGTSPDLDPGASRLPRWPAQAWARVSSAYARVQANPLGRAVLFPPNVGLFLGLLAALVPGLHGLFFPLVTAPFSFVYDTAAFLGAAAVPISMTIFGAALTTVDLDRATLRQYPGVLWSGIVLAVYHLLLLPAIGIGMVYVATSAGWVPEEEKMLRFVLMAQGCMPTAQICVVITQYLHPRGESKEMATIMLVQYAAAMVTLTGSLAFIFKAIA